MLTLPGFNKTTVHLIKSIYARFYACFSIINLDFISQRFAARLKRDRYYFLHDTDFSNSKYDKLLYNEWINK